MEKSAKLYKDTVLKDTIVIQNKKFVVSLICTSKCHALLETIKTDSFRTTLLVDHFEVGRCKVTITN